MHRHPCADHVVLQLTYRIGIDHKFDNGVLIYASKNLGFKSGGYNSTQPSLANFDPEILKAYEVGAKTEFLDHKVRFQQRCVLL